MAEPVAAVDPPRCACGGLIRPNVVWFGEALPDDAWQRSVDAVSNADVVVVVGTSSIVYPAAGLPELALASGTAVIEVNPEPTPLSHSATAVAPRNRGHRAAGPAAAPAGPAQLAICERAAALSAGALHKSHVGGPNRAADREFRHRQRHPRRKRPFAPGARHLEPGADDGSPRYADGCGSCRAAAARRWRRRASAAAREVRCWRRARDSEARRPGAAAKAVAAEHHPALR